MPCKYPSKSKCKVKRGNETERSDGEHKIDRRAVDYEEVEIIDGRKCNSRSLQSIMLQVSHSS